METLYLFYKGIHLGEKQVSEIIDQKYIWQGPAYL